MVHTQSNTMASLSSSHEIEKNESDNVSCSSDEDDIPTLLDLGTETESLQNNNDNNSSRESKHGEMKKVPVTILTGFLGSGKTTLIQYILHSPDHHYKIAIIENEFAGLETDTGNEGDNTINNNNAEANSLAIESLIARDGTSSYGNGNNRSGNDDANDKSNLISLTELPNGCVCCSVKDSLVSTLESLVRLKGDELDYIIIEASGMANPGPIASIFWLDEQLESQLRLDGIVTLVDAKHIEMQLRETGKSHPSSNASHSNDGSASASANDNTAGFEAERQIAYADRIMVNKIDLLPTKQELDKVLEIVSKINPTAPVKTTVYSKLSDLKWILNADCLDAERVQNVLSLEEELVVNMTSDQKDTNNDCCESDQTHDHHGHSHHDCCESGETDSCCEMEHNHSHSHHDHKHQHQHSHSHTSSVQTITLVYPKRSVNLKRIHAWLAKILWPDQDKADKDLRWLVEEGENAVPPTSDSSSLHMMRIFRMKGILSVCHVDLDKSIEEGLVEEDEMHFINRESGFDMRRYIVQVVHDLWEVHAGSDNLRWDGAHKEEPGCKFVLIGQWLNKQEIKDGFESCLV